jgi:hypothetical protein
MEEQIHNEHRGHRYVINLTSDTEGKLKAACSVNGGNFWAIKAGDSKEAMISDATKQAERIINNLADRSVMVAGVAYIISTFAEAEKARAWLAVNADKTSEFLTHFPSAARAGFGTGFRP